MEQERKTRFSEQKARPGSLFDKWKYDSETMTVPCKDGKRRTLKEIVELEKKG